MAISDEQQFMFISIMYKLDNKTIKDQGFMSSTASKMLSFLDVNRAIYPNCFTTPFVKIFDNFFFI